MRKLIHYLFPPRRLQSQLPLLPLEWSGQHSRHEPVQAEDADNLKGHGLARTSPDAQRLMSKYKGQPVEAIIKTHKRKRRREPRLRKAWRRLKALW